MTNTDLKINDPSMTARKLNYEILDETQDILMDCVCELTARQTGGGCSETLRYG